MILTVLFLFIALWCWFGRGPYLLRWPALLGVVAMTSGHPLAAMLGKDLEPLAEPLLALFFAILGLMIIFRAVFGPSRRRHHHHDVHPGNWNGPHHRRYGRRNWDEW